MKIDIKEIRYGANIISLFRLFLSIPLLYIFTHFNEINGAPNYILLVIFIAFLSDLADGFIARKTNTVSELGKIIDPLADKTLTILVITYLFILNYIPLMYLIIIISRDILIISGGLLLSKKVQYVPASDMVGKVTIFSIGLFIITALLEPHTVYPIKMVFMYFSGIMVFVSLINYYLRFRKLSNPI